MAKLIDSLENTGSPVGIVVIGRNEGARLKACLRSVCEQSERIVYVDSGSTDQSVALASSYGISVVELDPAKPFTAARARNTGLAFLAKHYGEVEFIQFVDGDCDLDAGWIKEGLSFLNAHEDSAVVGGRLRERHPEASIFNRLCDMEWDGPSGEVISCGGVALFRTKALLEVGGFNGELIAGEEPDLCFRLRRAGWTINRIDAPMGTHDAAMFHPSQWWQRARRSGYADREARVLRGDVEPHLRRRVKSNYFWSLPIAWPLWPVLWLRCFRKRGALFATHIVLGKLPHAVGQLEHRRRERRGVRRTLIEHK